MLVHPTSLPFARRLQKGSVTTFPPSVRSTIPKIHDFLDKIVPLANSTSQKDLRAHLAILLLLGSSRRLNDLVSIHRHQDSLRFNITALDVPSWASSCSTPRQSYIAWLQDMHLLENRDIKNTEFITLSFRGFSTKTSQGSYSPWVTLTECRFFPALCPIRSAIAYLRATEGVFESLPGDSRAPCTKALALFVIINGTPRKPLQSNTLAGVVRAIVHGNIIKVRRTLDLENSPHTPHSLRGCAASYKIAYGVSKATVLQLGNWQSEITFNHCYFRLNSVPINVRGLSDISVHDWRVIRAHALLQLPTLPELT